MLLSLRCAHYLLISIVLILLRDVNGTLAGTRNAVGISVRAVGRSRSPSPNVAIRLHTKTSPKPERMPNATRALDLPSPNALVTHLEPTPSNFARSLKDTAMNGRLPKRLAETKQKLGGGERNAIPLNEGNAHARSNISEAINRLRSSAFARAARQTLRQRLETYFYAPLKKATEKMAQRFPTTAQYTRFMGEQMFKHIARLTEIVHKYNKFKCFTILGWVLSLYHKGDEHGQQLNLAINNKENGGINSFSLSDPFTDITPDFAWDFLRAMMSHSSVRTVIETGAKATKIICDAALARGIVVRTATSSVIEYFVKKAYTQFNISVVSPSIFRAAGVTREEWEGTERAQEWSGMSGLGTYQFLTELAAELPVFFALVAEERLQKANKGEGGKGQTPNTPENPFLAEFAKARKSGVITDGDIRQMRESIADTPQPLPDLPDGSTPENLKKIFNYMEKQDIRVNLPLQSKMQSSMAQQNGRLPQNPSVKEWFAWSDYSKAQSQLREAYMESRTTVLEELTRHLLSTNFDVELKKVTKTAKKATNAAKSTSSYIGLPPRDDSTIQTPRHSTISAPDSPASWNEKSSSSSDEALDDDEIDADTLENLSGVLWRAVVAGRRLLTRNACAQLALVGVEPLCDTVLLSPSSSPSPSSASTPPMKIHTT